MRTLQKREWIAVSVAIVAAAILFFGGTLWRFFFQAGVTSSAAAPLTGPGADTSKMKNISTVEGLEIYDMQVGTGAEAVPGSVVSAHYVGRLAADGTQFDSSLERGQPFEFKLGTSAVIKGWDLGIAGMKVGGVRQLVVSPEYGYGAQSIGPIPANSTLIFEVQLVDVR